MRRCWVFAASHPLSIPATTSSEYNQLWPWMDEQEVGFMKQASESLNTREPDT